MFQFIRGEPRPVYVLKRWCRSKKRRIRKKWAKNRRNYRFSHYEQYTYALPNGTVLCDPVTFNEAMKLHDSIFRPAGTLPTLPLV